VPINDLPTIVVPRPTGLIEFSEDSTPQLQTVTGEKGLDIIDADLFECGSCSSMNGTQPASFREKCIQTIDPATGLLSEWEPGRMTVTASVTYGRLSIETTASPGIKPMPDWAKLEFGAYFDPKCSEDK